MGENNPLTIPDDLQRSEDSHFHLLGANTWQNLHTIAIATLPPNLLGISQRMAENKRTANSVVCAQLTTNRQTPTNHEVIFSLKGVPLCRKS